MLTEVQTFIGLVLSRDLNQQIYIADFTSWNITPRHKTGSVEGRLPVPYQGVLGVGGAEGGGLQMAAGSKATENSIAFCVCRKIVVGHGKAEVGCATVLSSCGSSCNRSCNGSCCACCSSCKLAANTHNQHRPIRSQISILSNVPFKRITMAVLYLSRPPANSTSLMTQGIRIFWLISALCQLTVSPFHWY